jgi:hypothetical protein
MTKIEGSGSISQRHGSADPDPPENVMDPQHCYQLRYAAPSLIYALMIIEHIVYCTVILSKQCAEINIHLLRKEKKKSSALRKCPEIFSF